MNRWTFLVVAAWAIIVAAGADYLFGHNPPPGTLHLLAGVTQRTSQYDARDNERFGSVTNPPATVKMVDAVNPSRKINGIYIGPQVSNVSVSNLIFDTQGNESSAIAAVGRFTYLSGITQTGRGRVLTVSDAVNLVAENLVTKTSTEYAVFGGKITGQGPRDIELHTFDFNLPIAPHAIRVEGPFEDVSLGHGVKRLPNSPYAFKVVCPGGPSKFEAITFRLGNRYRMTNGSVEGWVSFGLYDGLAGRPGWDKFEVANGEITNCLFKFTHSYFWLRPGIRNLTVTDSTIDSSGACLNIEGSKTFTKNGVTATWLAPRGVTFLRCKFRGTKMFTDASLPNLQGVFFIDCTLNGFPVGLKGE